MKPTRIEFSFDDTKLEAIHLFLKEKDSTLDVELDHFMDALYKKYVPQQVREYIEMKEAEAVQTVPGAKVSKRRKPSAAGEPVSEASLAEATTRSAVENPA